MSLFDSPFLVQFETLLGAAIFDTNLPVVCDKYAIWRLIVYTSVRYWKTFLVILYQRLLEHIISNT
jgi:hypothetical protein